MQSKTCLLGPTNWLRYAVICQYHNSPEGTGNVYLGASGRALGSLNDPKVLKHTTIDDQCFLICYVCNLPTPTMSIRSKLPTWGSNSEGEGVWYRTAVGCRAGEGCVGRVATCGWVDSRFGITIVPVFLNFLLISYYIFSFGASLCISHFHLLSFVW